MSGQLFELQHLRAFVAVAEELNFRRAAVRLNMTQPPLSRQIGLLEHAVGARLLDRTNRSVRLTAAGRRFLSDAVEILTRAESAALFARQAARGESGTIILGFVPSAAIEVIPRIIARLRADMPGVQLTLREMMTFELIEGLLAGSLEIGLLRLPHRNTGLPLRKAFLRNAAVSVFAVLRKACAAGLACFRLRTASPTDRRQAGVRGFLTTPGQSAMTCSDKPRSETNETPSPFSTDLMMVMTCK